MTKMPQDPEDEQRMRVGCAQELQWGGQLLSGLAIFKQDSIKTAVIIPAFHKQGAKTSIVIVNKYIKKYK